MKCHDISTLLKLVSSPRDKPNLHTPKMSKTKKDSYFRSSNKGEIGELREALNTVGKLDVSISVESACHVCFSSS